MTPVSVRSTPLDRKDRVPDANQRIFGKSGDKVRRNTIVNKGRIITVNNYSEFFS
jgi:hypothetical protein